MSRTRMAVSIVAAAGVLLIAGASLVWAFPLERSAAANSSPSQSARGDTGATDIAGEAGSAQKNAKVYQVGDDVQAPTPVYTPGPRYTQQARKNHLNGIVILSLVVDAKGRVTQVSERSKPLGAGLDENAIDAVRTWKFKPGMRKGAPVPVRISVEVTFRSEKDKEPGKTFTNSGAGPAAPAKQSDSAAVNQTDKPATVNRADLKRQVEQAIRQSVNKQTIETSIRQALQQATLAQQLAGKVTQDQIQRQIEQALKQAHLAQQTLGEINQAEIERQVEQAMNQAKLAQQTAPKINQTEIQQQIEQALKQAKIAQRAASEINKADIERQIEQAFKQAKAAHQHSHESQQGKNDSK